MSEVKFNIELGSLIDGPAIASKLYTAFEQEEKQPIDDKERENILMYVLRSFSDPNHITLVAKVEKHKKKKIVGLLMFRIMQHPYGQLVVTSEHMYIEPAFRHNGISHALVEKGLNIARAAGATEAYVESSFPKFFEGFGFKYYSTLMRLKLNKSEGE